MIGNYFKAEWSNYLIVSTVIVTAAGLASFYWTSRMVKAPGMEMRIMGVSLISIMIGVLVFSYLLAPEGYLIDANKLTIVRPLSSIVIPLIEVSGAEAATPELMSGSIRLLGSGGLWGYYGKYQNDQLGRYYMYARRTTELVLIRSRENYVVAPERPLEFIQRLNSAILSNNPKEAVK
jgi:multisubunit Na+/H+ antiporter MnhF subunit